MLGNLFSIPIELPREAIQRVRFSDRPKVEQVKEKEHCSDIQLASRESGARVEDITSADLEVSACNLETSQNNDREVSMCKSEYSGEGSDINDSCVENLKERGEKMERLYKRETQISGEATCKK